MKKKIIYYALSALCLIGCVDDMAIEVSNQAMPIQIASTYPVAGTTRATDNGFVIDDAVGIFVVDYNEDGTSGTLALSGNRGSNVKFVYDGSAWNASYQLYWAGGSKTPADFYGYYPYDEKLSSVTEYPFAVRRNQASKGYMGSDLLWAKAEKVQPTTGTVNLRYKHLMAGVTVALEMGSGFTIAEWNKRDKVIQIENTNLSGTVDLSKGICNIENGKAEAITPLEYNGVWRALVFPQTVKSGASLLSITVDGQRYQLTKDADFTYYSGRMHNFTITVNRSEATGDLTFTLKADDIVAWVDDIDMHKGLVKAYNIIEVTEVGTLRELIVQKGLNYNTINSLKVIGPINSVDLQFMGQDMLALQNVNLQEAIIEEGVIGGFRDHTALQHFVFPKKGIKAIADFAFYNTGLSGALIIPEGIETIGACAYANVYHLTTLFLPSTIKRIEYAAFDLVGFTGELRLPYGLEYIDTDPHTSVFRSSDFEGRLNIPETLRELPKLAFPKITGEIKIPQHITILGDLTFENTGISRVEFHDGITEMAGATFRGAQLTGELVLPPNLKNLSGESFAGTKISRIIFPDNLRVMDDGAYDDSGIFANCVHLTGIVELPRNVARISKGCFYRCSGITGLIIPKSIDIIDNKAFYGCSGINSIICEDEEPPLVCDNAFFGVNKDNFTVEVPKGCVEKYRQAQGWSEFKRIAEYSDFVCRPAQVNALNTQHSETLVLNADGAWEVEHCPDWVTLSKTSGTGKTELRLTFNPMEHGAGNRRDSILFRMPEEEYTTYCVVSQYDYVHEEDSYLTLQEHTKGNGIDIVFIGDGFDGESIADGSYLELVKQQTEYFFGLEPYKSHREYFNVYVTFSLSQEKGVNTMYTYVNNRFGTLYGVDDQCSYNKLLIEADEVYDYALNHSPLGEDRINESLVVLVPNCADYSGNTVYAVNGWEPYGMTISICPPSNRPYPEDTRGVIQHEAGGHGFGKLADEEITYPDGRGTWATPNVVNEVEERHSWGWYQNIATTSNMKQVPWAEFIFDTSYSDYVDVYEGAYGYMRGIFRSEANSCMNYGIPYYNTISRLSIMRRIFDYAREPFSMDYFYEHDTNKWGDRDGTTREGTAHAHFDGSSYAGSNQHVAPQMVDAKKQGNRVREIRARLKAERDSKRY